MNSSCSKKRSCGQIIESQRMPMPKSTEKSHKYHIADRGHVSLSHYNVVHNPIFIPQAVKSPATRVAINKVWDKWRMKQFPVCGMLIDATVLLVGHNSTTSHITTLTTHLSFSFFLTPQHIERQWKSRTYFIQEWYESKSHGLLATFFFAIRRRTDGSIIHFTSAASESKTSNFLRKTQRRLQSWRRRLACADSGFVNYQIHLTAVFMLHRPTNVTRTTLMMEPSWSSRPT